jgi:hypothetical protein
MADQPSVPRWLRKLLVELLVAIAIIAVVIVLLVPARSVIPRERFEGRDQFEWLHVIESAKPESEERQKAIAALCELMKRTPPKATVRYVASHALIKVKAFEAIPALREMLQSDEEDLRQYAQRTLDELDKKKKE